MVHGIRNPIASLEIDVAFDIVVDCKRELLLSNPKNKHKFIGLLMEGLEEGQRAPLPGAQALCLSQTVADR